MKTTVPRHIVCRCHLLHALVSLHRLKKLLLVAVGILAGLQVQGQGTVNFSNRGLNAPVYSLSCSNTAVLAAAGTMWSVALYWAPYNPANPNVQPDPATLIQVGAPANLAAPGIYDDGSRAAPITPPGGLGWFQVKGWEAAYGSTYEQASASGLAQTGVSNTILIPTGNPTAIPPENPHQLTGISPIVIRPLGVPPCVPEPSAPVLAFCGAAILLFSASRHRNN